MSPKRSKQKRAESYEKRKAREHRGQPVGGPGEPDYTRGEIEGEVKYWEKPMGKADVMKEARKGRTEIVSKKGFTEEALEYAKRYRPNLTLFNGKKKVKRRKKS